MNPLTEQWFDTKKNSMVDPNVIDLVEIEEGRFILPIDCRRNPNDHVYDSFRNNPEPIYNPFEPNDFEFRNSWAYDMFMNAHNAHRNAERTYYAQASWHRNGQRVKETLNDEARKELIEELKKMKEDLFNRMKR